MDYKKEGINYYYRMNGGEWTLGTTFGTTPYYYGLLATSNTQYVDDFVIGTSESSDLILTIPEDWFVAKDFVLTSYTGIYSSPDNMEYEEDLHMKYVLSAPSQTIKIKHITTDEEVYSTETGSNLYGYITFNVTSMLFNTDAPFGLYKIYLAEDPEIYDTFTYKAIVTTGTYIECDNDTYYDNDVIQMEYAITETYWLPENYKYEVRMMDDAFDEIESFKITERPTPGYQTSTVTQSKYHNTGYYYASLYAIDRSSGEDILMDYDTAYVDVTWSDTGSVTIEGETYDATTGSVLGSVAVTATQGGDETGTTSNAIDGSYTIDGLLTWKSIGVTGEKDGFEGYSVYFTPYSSGTYEVDLPLVPEGGAEPGDWYDVTGGQVTVITHSNATVSYYNSTEDGTSIGGITYLAPYWSAGEEVSCTLSNTTWDDTQVCDEGGWYQFNNLNPSASYTLSCSKDGYQSVETPCALTGGCFNRQDVYLGSDFTLTVNMKDLESGGLITGTTITVSLSTGEETTTTTGTATFEDVSYGVIDIETAAMGYYPGSGSVAMDASKSATVYMQVRPETTIAPVVPPVYAGHQVRFVVQDNFGRPLEGVNITAQAIEASTPWSWITNLLGIESTEDMDIQNTTLSGTTGTDGSWTTIMVESVKYRMTFTEEDLGINVVRDLYPKEDEYVIWIRLREVVNASAYPDYLVWAEDVDIDTVAIKMMYHDPGLGTTDLDYYILDSDGAIVHTHSWSPVTTEYTNHSYNLDNVKGEQYTFGFNATHEDYGEISFWKGITMKGTGLLVDLGFEDSNWYMWISLCIVFIVGGCFHISTVKQGVIVTPLMAGLFWYIGWLPAWIGGFIGLAGALGVLIHMRKQEYKTGR